MAVVIAVTLSLLIFTMLALTIANAVFFTRMGEVLRVPTLAIVFGAHRTATLRTIRAQLPFDLILCAACTVYTLSVVCIGHAARMHGGRALSKLVASKRATLLWALAALWFIVASVEISTSSPCRQTTMTNALLRLAMESRRELTHTMWLPRPSMTLHVEVPAASASSRSRHGNRTCDGGMCAAASDGDVCAIVHNTAPAAGKHGSKRGKRGERLEASAELPSMGAHPSARPSGRAPDVVLVLLESVRYRDMPTVGGARMQRNSRTVARLKREGLLVHAPRAYSTTPNSMKSLYAATCGILPEPKLRDGDYTKEYDTQSALLQGCLPNMLRRGPAMGPAMGNTRSQPAYRSSFFTSSVAVGELHGRLGYDHYEGFAGQGLGLAKTAELGEAGRAKMNKGTPQKLRHGSFERVNWLGLDDEVLLTPTMESIQAAKASGQSAFVTLFTVGTHSFFGVPSRAVCRDGVLTDDGNPNNESRRPYQGRAATPAESHMRYRCSVMYADAWLSRLVAQLKEQDDAQLSNTLLIVAGDHGEAFEEHGRSDHGMSLFDEETRVPLWLAGGPVRRAREAGLLRVSSKDRALSGIYRLEDIRPTVLDLIGWGCRTPGTPPPRPRSAAAEAASVAQMYATLGQLGLAGESMLSLSRASSSLRAMRSTSLAAGLQSRAPARSILLVGLFGERKIGLLEWTAGRIQKTIIAWEGCAESCRLIHAARYDLSRDGHEQSSLGFKGSSSTAGGIASRLRSRLSWLATGDAGSDGGMPTQPEAGMSTELPSILKVTFGQMHALISLHLHMRLDDTTGAHLLASQGRRKGKGDGRRRAMRLLGTWLKLSQGNSSSDNFGVPRAHMPQHLQVPPNLFTDANAKACLCDLGKMDYGSCTSPERLAYCHHRGRVCLPSYGFEGDYCASCTLDECQARCSRSPMCVGFDASNIRGGRSATSKGPCWLKRSIPATFICSMSAELTTYFNSRASRTPCRLRF